MNNPNCAVCGNRVQIHYSQWLTSYNCTYCGSIEHAGDSVMFGSRVTSAMRDEFLRKTNDCCKNCNVYQNVEQNTVYNSSRSSILQKLYYSIYSNHLRWPTNITRGAKICSCDICSDDYITRIVDR